MKRTGFLLLGALAVAACGGSGDNPLTGGPDPVDPDTGTGGLEGSATFTGQVNALTYDAATDTVIINNLPFDGPAGTYTNTGVTAVRGFGLYESEQTFETGRRQYYAVFRQSDSGAVSAAAVGTGDYQEFGFGGSALARSTTAVALPTSGEAVYTGRYGGLRILDGGRGTGDVELVSGNAVLDVDFGDFDVTGAVEGAIANRTYYDRFGNRLGTLPTVILGTSTIDTDGRITGGSAGTSDSEGDPLQSGTWEGLFGGDAANEIAGVIIITGPEVEGADIQVQETGVFTAID